MIAKFYAFILIISVIIAGCNVTRNVKDGEHLLIKNSIALNKEESGVQKLNFSTDELPSILQQKPNKNFLGFLRVGLWVNSVTGKGKETGFKRWLNKNFGQEPIIFDPFLVDRSVDQLQLYLDNHGFFNSTIQTTLKKKGKKARVYYHIALSKPYRINEINYNIEDTALRRIVFGNLKGSLMKRDQIYKSSTLDDERYRIKSLLRNEGYYYFTPDYIFYKVDSALNSHQMNLELNIQQVEIASDTNALLTKKRNHQKFYLNNIFINPDFNPLKTDASNMETFINPNPDKGINRYVFYYRDKLRIRPRAIRSSIFLEPLKKYREKGEKNTYKQLSGFPLFGYTSLEFRQVTNKSNIPDSTRNYLNCSINLTRRPVQSFSLETEGTTSSGKLGMAGNFVYQNLNIFRGGEVFTVKLTGGFEWQSGGGTGNDVFLFFNTFETGAEASLDFPKFLAPVSQDKMPKMLRPRTTIKTGISYQNRPDYERYISNISFGYNWRAKEFISHSLIPIEVNSV
nr:hypothetical protein [Bacteroidota bacterium]